MYKKFHNETSQTQVKTIIDTKNSYYFIHIVLHVIEFIMTAMVTLVCHRMT